MLERVLDGLMKGQIVCFPTETLYAMACNALNESAVQKLYELKRRPYNKQFSILVSDTEQISRLSDIKAEDLKLISKLSPGPITFVLPLRNNSGLPKLFFQNTIGIRIPNHKVSLEILRLFGSPIAATSTNLSGSSSISRFEDIPAKIKNGISAFIDDDSTVMGLCSTVFDVQSRRVLRKGALSQRKIHDILGEST